MSGIHGADTSTAVSVTQWQALQSEHGVSFGVVRCYKSNGSVDADAPSAVKNGWLAPLEGVDVYHFPCLAQAAALQVGRAVSALKAEGATFGTYWLDVEKGAGWTGDRTANAAFLQSLVEAAEALGLTVGIYTTQFQWSTIMGASCEQFARYPLWYAHYEDPQNASFSDFTPFGGWTQPSRKQFVGNVTCDGVSYDGNWCPAPPAGRAELSVDETLDA
jgi:GH25 family lysozyme M1 (1,4-beta-N-acetylmuramidase)